MVMPRKAVTSLRDRMIYLIGVDLRVLLPRRRAKSIPQSGVRAFRWVPPDMVTG